MLRRNIRLRKEYLYLKKIEEEKKKYAEKIKSIKESYEHNKKIKKDLKHEENELRKKMDLYDEKCFSRLDDEYFFSGYDDPRVLITTSRNPSNDLINFTKEIKQLIPNSQKMNRGSYYIKDIVHFAKKNNITDLIIIHEHKGKPTNLIISHLPFGPTLFCTVTNSKTRHDFKEHVDHMPACYPHLIFHNFNSDLGKRVMNIFKYLFPPIKMRSTKKKRKINKNKDQGINSLNTLNENDENDENDIEINIKNNNFHSLEKLANNRIITFFNKNDLIYFRHYTWVTNEKNEIVLTEIGPRFNLFVYKINKESLDSLNEEYEYIYRPFLNSKKKLLT